MQKAAQKKSQNSKSSKNSPNLNDSNKSSQNFKNLPKPKNLDKRSQNSTNTQNSPNEHSQKSQKNPQNFQANLQSFSEISKFDENPRLSGAYLGFFKAARVHFKGRIFADFLRRFAYGIEASCYRYVPKIVIWAQNEAEIALLFTLSNKFSVPLCFRAAGTSLSGQASCYGVLVVCNEFWKKIRLNFGSNLVQNLDKKPRNDGVAELNNGILPNSSENSNLLNFSLSAKAQNDAAGVNFTQNAKFYANLSQNTEFSTNFGENLVNLEQSVKFSANLKQNLNSKLVDCHGSLREPRNDGTATNFTQNSAQNLNSKVVDCFGDKSPRNDGVVGNSTQNDDLNLNQNAKFHTNSNQNDDLNLNQNTEFSTNLKQNSQQNLNNKSHNDSVRITPSSIFLDCGVIGADANAALKAFGRKIGPDPATINNALIGGIFSNNSSGMCCGVRQNSYQTIKSIRVILNDGFVLDTSKNATPSESVENFAKTHPQIAQKLLNLREKILADSELSAMIRRKFAIKNTTGYALNALLDFSALKDILNHIFIGAEGTLGFISRVEYECVEDFAHKACALLFYEDLGTASAAVKILAKHDDIVSAAEIMDYACLRQASTMDGMAREISRIKAGNCAILVQLESNDLENLNANLDKIKAALSPVKSLFGVNFSFDEKEQNSWWKIRKALLPLTAATRESGATVITEDICFEIEKFAPAMQHTSELFDKHGYTGIIFGHALSGNVHFIITPLLNDSAEISRFGVFMSDLAAMVKALGGSTKAEHGTGRMVAPFVELEWGEKAYAINREIKGIFDPRGLINPDVIISSDPQIHLKCLKPASQRLIEDYLDACMECGFCEKICPSKHLSLTPRQRIGVLREIRRLESLENRTSNQKAQLKALRKGYKFLAIDTCATCSMCATLCPLEIDSAKIALKFNSASGGFGEKIALNLSKNLAKSIKYAKFGVNLCNFAQKTLGKSGTKSISKTLHKVLQTPILLRFMPRVNSQILSDKISLNSRGKVVYFSSCLNQIFKAEKKPISQCFESLCAKANFSVIYPQISCCGKAFKNYEKVSREVAKKAYFELVKMSANGEIPIVCDHSACSLELLKRVREFEAENLNLDVNLNENSAVNFNENSNLNENLAKNLAVNLGKNSHENLALNLAENSRKNLAKNAKNLSSKPLKIYDMPKFIYEFLVPFLKFTPKHEKIALYAPCGTRNLAVAKEGWEDALTALARLCADEVAADAQVKCCGFAGNKGFSTPELNENALKYFGATQICGENGVFSGVKRGFSSSSTCEIGLSDKTNFAWKHIVYLVDEATSQGF